MRGRSQLGGGSHTHMHTHMHRRIRTGIVTKEKVIWRDSGVTVITLIEDHIESGLGLDSQ